MTDDDPPDDPRKIPLNRYPDPVLTYSVEDRHPRVRGVNDRFRAVFGALPDDESVVSALDRPGVTVKGDVDVVACIEHEERFVLRVAPSATSPEQDQPGEYFVAIVPGGDGNACGHLVFTEMTDLSSSGTRVTTDLGAESVASAVSHDLRNPLDVAKARLRAARETGEDEHFDRVERAHDRMERIVRDVLTLVRGDEAVSPSESVPLGSVARDAWATVDTQDATLELSTPLPTVTVDRDRGQRLFENLFRNSVEHGSTESEDDSQSPNVQVGPLEAATGWGFYVADDGPGIVPVDRAAVFEPGYSTHDHGTGLGLAIVERIATAHGWTVEVTESADGGARFEVRADPDQDVTVWS